MKRSTPPEPIFTATATTKAALCRRIQSLPDGKKFRVAIVAHRERRSDQQNRYYWGVVLPCVLNGLREAWGETSLSVEEVHEYMKIRFLRKPIIDRRNGEARGHTIPSTPKLQTAEFAAYLEQIFEFAASSLGVVIPEASWDAPCIWEEKEKAYAHA